MAKKRNPKVYGSAAKRGSVHSFRAMRALDRAQGRAVKGSKRPKLKRV